LSKVTPNDKVSVTNMNLISMSLTSICDSCQSLLLWTNQICT
ncbi:hypothetical protein HMPREF0530_2711, partial [Lacticaseibacillus paracasei subsp. paracasei ATCC 25302 = DSM 5622 = JCM 8130]